MSASLPEPWLRGDITDVHPILAQVLYSFRHAIEDLQTWTDGLNSEQLWSRPFELAPVGFHIRHIGGSVDRLLTYARGEELQPSQLADLRVEMDPGTDRETLLSRLHSQLTQAANEVRDIDPHTFDMARTVGRNQLPTTVGGLLVHAAEHTQRHVGQAVTTTKLLKGMAAAKQLPD